MVRLAATAALSSSRSQGDKPAIAAVHCCCGLGNGSEHAAGSRMLLLLLLLRRRLAII